MHQTQKPGIYRVLSLAAYHNTPAKKFVSTRVSGECRTTVPGDGRVTLVTALSLAKDVNEGST